MEKDFTKNLRYKLTEVKKKKVSGDLLVAIRLKDDDNNEYAWWPKIESLFEALFTVIAIQKQYKENKEELDKFLKMLEGES